MLVIDPGQPMGMIRRVAIDAQERSAVTISDDKTVRVRSVETGEQERAIRIPAGPDMTGKLYAVALSPDGTLIAAGGRTAGEKASQHIYLIDRKSGAVVRRITRLHGSRLLIGFPDTTGLEIRDGHNLTLLPEPDTHRPEAWHAPAIAKGLASLPPYEKGDDAAAAPWRNGFAIGTKWHLYHYNSAGTLLSRTTAPAPTGSRLTRSSCRAGFPNYGEDDSLNLHRERG